MFENLQKQKLWAVWAGNSAAESLTNGCGGQWSQWPSCIVLPSVIHAKPNTHKNRTAERIKEKRALEECENAKHKHKFQLPQNIRSSTITNGAPPLHEKSFCQKKLSGIGAYPHPLNGKNPISSFDGTPF